jgi:hypothetical protein
MLGAPESGANGSGGGGGGGGGGICGAVAATGASEIFDFFTPDFFCTAAAANDRFVTGFFIGGRRCRCRRSASGRRSWRDE